MKEMKEREEEEDSTSFAPLGLMPSRFNVTDNCQITIGRGSSGDQFEGTKEESDEMR